MKPSSFTSWFQRFISGILIFTILFSQTVQVSWFSTAQAEQNEYYDVVSIFVDRGTYGSLRSEITQYASDIQSYLPDTRTSIHVVDTNVKTAQISALNEKLYYEGDGGAGVSHLVGTILIGDIPIPIVTLNGKTFPSVFPYVDFTNKEFIYDREQGVFLAGGDGFSEGGADIWHGVIDPSLTGPMTPQDREKLRGFFIKTHNFYTKSGNFAQFTTQAPRVFYHDAKREFSGLSLADLYAYTLSMEHAEDIVFNRYSHYFAEYLINSVNLYNQSIEDTEIADFLTEMGYTGSSSIDADTLRNTPDIQTEKIITATAKKFYEIVNSKSLGEMRDAVRNAGRYNSGTEVRVDMTPVDVTALDTASALTLRSANEQLEQMIDREITGYARRIPILDSVTITHTGTKDPDSGEVSSGYTTEDRNYFFGMEASGVTDPSMCTIARGAEHTGADFRDGILVEANQGYDIRKVQANANLLADDSRALAQAYRNTNATCFLSGGVIRLRAYWGGNSGLNLSTGSFLTFKNPTFLTGFSESIFSLGGMRETDRMRPASPLDCTSDNYQYTLRQPFTRPTGGGNIGLSLFGGATWPELGRFTCMTEHMVGISPKFRESYARYMGAPACFEGTLTLDGKVIAGVSSPCITYPVSSGEASPSDATDNTTYEDQVYHTIPSILFHKSPTNDEYQSAKKNGATQSLAIDHDRYVEFLTPKGQLARIIYPNFFRMKAETVEDFRSELRELSESTWKTVMQNEQNASDPDATIAPLFVTGNLPIDPPDWNRYLTDDAIRDILRMRQWLRTDPYKKYTSAMESMLSISHGSGSTGVLVPGVVPNAGNRAVYDIAYLALGSFTPDTTPTDLSSLLEKIGIDRANISNANLTETGSEVYSNSSTCGPPEGVTLLKWFPAIICWLKSILPPRISAGSCGGNSSSSSSSLSSQSPTSMQEVDGRYEFLSGGSLELTASRSMLLPGESMNLEMGYTKNGNMLDLFATEYARLEIMKIVDRSSGKTVYDDPTGTGKGLPEYLTAPVSDIPMDHGKASVAVTAGMRDADITLRAHMGPFSPGSSTGIIEAVSDTVTLLIRNERIEITANDGSDGGSLLHAGSGNITLSFTRKNGSGEVVGSFPPYRVVITDTLNETVVFSGTTNEPFLSLPSSLASRAGSLHVEVYDSEGGYGGSDTTLLPSDPVNLVIHPYSSSLRQGLSSPVLLTLEDQYGNRVDSSLHTIRLSVKNGYIILPSGEKAPEAEATTIEGYALWEVGSEASGRVELTATLVDSTLSSSTSLRVLSDVRLDITQSALPVAGGGPVSFTMRLSDPEGNILSDVSTLANLSIPSDVGIFSSGVIRIASGVADPFTFIPQKQAGSFDAVVHIPGLIDTETVRVVIGAGPSMYVTLEDAKEKGVVRATLRDRYGNVTADSFEGTYRYYGVGGETIFTFSSGIADIPRRSGYLIIHVPSLESASFTVSDSARTLEIPGVSDAVLYVANDPELPKVFSDYNSLYTVLPGADYTDLASQILYDTDPDTSVSLAVTTLIGDPVGNNRAFSLSSRGVFSLASSSSEDLYTTSVLSSDGRIFLRVMNDFTHEVVGDITPLFSHPSLVACDTSGTCDGGGGSSAITLTPLDPSLFAEKDGNRLTLSFSGEAPLFSIDTTARVSLGVGYILHTDDTYDGSGGLALLLSLDDQDIARILLTPEMNSSISLDTSVPAEDTFSLTLGNAYRALPIHTSSLSDQALGYDIVKRTQSEVTLDNSLVGPNGKTGFEKIIEEGGVGWGGSNTTLLTFAGGETVGNATKWESTYLMVNLGDPVAHLEMDAPGVIKNGLDRTVGHAINGIGKGSIASYKVTDINNDGYDDLLVLYDTSYVELFLNEKGRFRSRGYIAHIVPAGRGTLEVGDFTGDHYGDLVLVTTLGDLALIDNTARKLTRIALTIPGSTIPHHITQMKVFDMDADGRSDIVYLSEGGEMGILYGTETPGVFTQNIVASDLSVTLSSAPHSEGGAIVYDGLPQLPVGYVESNTLDEGSGANEAMLLKHVYFQRTVVGNSLSGSSSTSAISASVGTNEDGSANTDLANEVIAGFSGFASGTTSGSPASSIDTITYIRSEYAPAKGITIERVYTTSGSTLQSESPITVTIRIKNNSTGTLRNIEYLDAVPSIFSTADTKEYTITQGDQVSSGKLIFLNDEFTLSMGVPDIVPGGAVTLTYRATTYPLQYGKMLVGRFEAGEAGDDEYGDIAFDAKSTCGASILLWRSTASRSYERGVRDFSKGDIPDELKKYFTDTNKNGTPDYIENMTIEERQQTMDTLNENSDPDIFVDPVNTDDGNLTITIGLTDELESKISSMVDTITTGFSCGFGGGSCVSFPMNWAPLAPGSAPTVFGIPLGIMSPSTGIPVFSSITGVPLYGPWGCIPVPTVWPVSPIGFANTCTANLPSAGGYLGTWDPTNAVRIYITPTLTLGMGEAVCFGGPALATGLIPPPGLSPLITGGNCIVTAHAMPFCKEDGSEDDGDVKGISGLGTLTNAWNASSCQFDANTTTSSGTSQDLHNSILDYLKNPTSSKLSSIYSGMSSAGSTGFSAGPLAQIGSGDGAMSIDVTIDTRKSFSFQDIVKIKNKSVSAFPDFIMDWVDRQIEEIVNKFLTLPTLTIILPQPSQNWSIVDFSKGWGTLSNTWNSTKEKSAFPNTQRFIPKKILSLDTSSVSTSIANGTNALRSAYEFIGKLPFVQINSVNVPISIPWITGEDLDKALASYKLQYESYKTTVNQALANWCATGNTPECLNSKLHLNSSTFLSDLEYNIKMLESYKRFPEKLKKLLTWKQRLIDQITCNIDAVERMVGGWLRDNSIRFRAWVELIVLLRAILKSWQPILDLFSDYQKNCTVCRNERYDLKYFIFKIISAVIPDLPVIRFPKWPDIILDLHDIRAGIRITVPEFSVNPVPIRLPSLPSLSLPSAPNATFVLPSIPRLPALPEIPDLPELPSFPTITLPDLPPPPKLPKLFGSIAGVLKILKVVQKIMCLLRKEIFVPEWRAGDVIAQRTERQGTLSLDFLNIQFPQLSLSFMKEIRVATHVNLEYKTDFLVEMAQSIVAPINTFSSDLSSRMNVSVPNLPSVPSVPSTQIQLYHDSGTGNHLTFAQSLGTTLQSVMHVLETQKESSVSTAELKSMIRNDLEQNGEGYTAEARSELLFALAENDFGSEALTEKLIAENTRKFDRIRAYLATEQRELDLLENMLNMDEKSATLELVLDPIPQGRMTNAEFSLAPPLHALESPVSAPSPLTRERERRIHDVHASQERDLQTVERSLRNTQNQDDPFTPLRKRLAYASETLSEIVSTQGVSTPTSSFQGAQMNYQGIYVLDDTKKQTRLFDWVGELSGDEDVILTDVDRDGDEDFIYRVGEVIYVKEHHTNTLSESHTPDSSLSTDPLTNLPNAVNGLHETITSPNSINITWSPANPDDRVFRIGFYDHFLRFDDEQAMRHSLDGKSIVDAVVTGKDPSSEESVHSSSYPLFVRSTRGDIGVESPGVRPLSGGDVFTLSAGHALYSADRGATIQITPSGSASVLMTLDPHMRYEFTEASDIRILEGKVYIEDDSVTEVSPIDLIGMPLLPDAHLTPLLTGASIEIGSVDGGSNHIVSYGSFYRVIDIGSEADSYTAHFDVPNGWYYGEVEALGTPGVRAKTVLMSPAREADRDGPLLDLPDQINVPVYVPFSVPLSEYISDRSDVTLSWDTDLIRDDDGDGNTENDFVITSPGIVSVSGTSIIFGPFTTLGDRVMMVRATDGNQNITEKKLTLSVYAPIPEVSSVDREVGMSGVIDTRVASEPIDIMRYRDGGIVRMTESSLLTDARGQFFFSLPASGESASVYTLTQSGITIARINLKTGNISDLHTGFDILVESASLDHPMKIMITDRNKKIVYTQTLALPSSVSLGESGSGVIVTPEEGYRFILNTLMATTLPGGGFLIDQDSQALAGIGRDGNIYTMDSSVSLEYMSDTSFTTIAIMKQGKIIARVQYKIEGVSLASQSGKL